MTTDAVSRRYADIETLVTMQDELRAETEAMLPDGYVLVGASLRRLREDLPDCIILQGAYGPVEVRGIPYDARRRGASISVRGRSRRKYG